MGNKVGKGKGDMDKSVDLQGTPLEEMKITKQIPKLQRIEWSFLEELPSPSYYVPRSLTLLGPIEIDLKIFTEFPKGDVILIKAANKLDIAKDVGYREMEWSGHYLHKLCGDFFHLAREEDFNRICGLTTKPVHLLEYKDGRYYWIKSSQNRDNLRRYFKNPVNGRIEEQEFLSKIINLSPLPAMIIIAPSGMGKTLLLSNLAQTVQKQMSSALVLFIDLRDFVEKSDFVNSSSLALDAIGGYFCSDSTKRITLLEMLKNDDVFLFFDAYDEVIRENSDIAETILTHLQELRNIKIILATGPQYCERLQNILCPRETYKILPFDVPTQVYSLTRIWTEKHVATESKILTDVAHQYITALEETLTQQEKELAAIPLRTMLLAEAFMNEAIKPCASKIFDRISLFEIYERFIERSFNKIPQEDVRIEYINVHVMDAIKLLFPNWTQTFQPYLNTREELDNDVFLQIGIVKMDSGVTSRFIHRTLAEFLLARFIATNLDKISACVDFLFGELLMATGNIRRKCEYGHFCELLHPGIGYFIECHLKKRVKTFSTLEISASTSANIGDVFNAIQICCHNNLEILFVYAAKLLSQLDIPEDVRDEQFRTLPHCVVHHSDDKAMLEKVLKFTWNDLNMDFSYHIKRDVDFGSIQISHCTPLHVAIRKGKYNMFEYLVQEYGDSVKEEKDLVSLCVSYTALQSKSVVENKKLIFRTLVDIDRNWLKETQHRSPILQWNVDLSFLQLLVKEGVDINTYSEIYGTVLHTGGGAFNELLCWALSSGFQLINHVDENKVTPLMQAISMDETDEEVLGIFGDAGADFNAQDVHGNTPLFYSLKRSMNVNFIQKMLDFGADLHHMNRKKQNALHMTLEGKGSLEEKLAMADFVIGKCPDFLDDQDSLQRFRFMQSNLHSSMIQVRYQWGPSNY